ncbi:RNA polymerase sigma24 factor [Rugosimonospora africana]|uniref:RNA polymerase sigma24 factor n=2 Tax=Rugosimonospora africana TaxID=556532 RepID=A0A8J3QT03_9ACTN|nr:RNA polymerase sigma24 factor [Rugosimonospora africana]
MTTRAEPGDGRIAPSRGPIMSEQRHLINLAYRLLGSLTDAEDVVQETYSRWYAMSRQQQDAIEYPAGWLRKVAGRICLDLLGSARARRESYVGEWIPEPLPDRTEWMSGRRVTTVDPADHVTLDESISMAFLIVLESMTPPERVAFILHDVFSYPFAEVADIVGRTPAACRQLASSARRRIRASPTPATPTARQADVVRTFKQAWEAKDVSAIIGLLDPDATVIADGGGLASAELRPVEGAEHIARTLVDIVGGATNLTFHECTVNGQPGLVAQQSETTVTVLAFDIGSGRIRRIWAVRNPEKLHPWSTGRGTPRTGGSTDDTGRPLMEVVHRWRRPARGELD